MGNGIAYRKPDAEHPIKAKDGLPGFGPMEAHAEAVQEVLVLARRAGLIPEEWVADTRAPDAIIPLSYRNADDYARQEVENMASYFALDAQRDQPVYIEVLCEAADLQPRLARVAGEYGVRVYGGAGFDGLKGKRAFAERAMNCDAPTVVLVIGDRDKAGNDIYIAAAEDAEAWADDKGHVYPVGTTLEQLQVERIHGLQCPALIFFRPALTTEQAKDLDLLGCRRQGRGGRRPGPGDGPLADRGGARARTAPRRHAPSARRRRLMTARHHLTAREGDAARVDRRAASKTSSRREEVRSR